MKKNNLYFSALVLILGLSFTNCHSKSDNSLYQTNALLFNYLNGLLAGNCAVVEKRELSTGTVYQATGATIPSGGCNSSTLGSTYSATAADIITLSDAYFDQVTAVLDSYPACAEASKLVKGTNTTLTGLNGPTGANAGILTSSSFVGISKAATTATNLATAANTITADFNNTSLSLYHPKNCFKVRIGLLGTVGIYCKTAEDINTAKGKITYNVVDSVQKDMNANFEGYRDILKAARAGSSGTSDSDATSKVNYYSSTAINGMRLMTSAEISTINSTSVRAKFDAYAATFVTIAALGSTQNSIACLTATSNASSTCTTAQATTGVGTLAGLGYTGLTTIQTEALKALPCFAALTAGDPVIKDYTLRIPNAYRIANPYFNSNIIPADRAAVTTPIVPNVSCVYGTGTTAVASSTNVLVPTTAVTFLTALSGGSTSSTNTAATAAAAPAEGLCPSSYKSF
jgi:hypothetical protein